MLIGSQLTRNNASVSCNAEASASYADGEPMCAYLQLFVMVPPRCSKLIGHLSTIVVEAKEPAVVAKPYEPYMVLFYRLKLQ